jgi:hypothetical protein
MKFRARKFAILRGKRTIEDAGDDATKAGKRGFFKSIFGR